MPKAWSWFALAAALVVVDQISKQLVLAHFAQLAPGTRIEVTGFFNIVLAYNRGAAFSFLAGASGWQTPLLAGFALIAAVVIAALIVRAPQKRIYCGALALILGGAIGNVIDRLRLGQVVDFLDLHVLGWHWPAFNAADSGITVGAILLILEGFVHHERRAGTPS